MGGGTVDFERLDDAMVVVSKYFCPMPEPARDDIEHGVIIPYLYNEEDHPEASPSPKGLRPTKDQLEKCLKSIRYWREDDCLQTREALQFSIKTLWLNACANHPLLDQGFPFSEFDRVLNHSASSIIVESGYSPEDDHSYLSSLCDEAYDLVENELKALRQLKGRGYWLRWNPFRRFVKQMAAHFKAITGEEPVLIHDRKEDRYSGVFFFLIDELSIALDIPTSAVDNKNAALGRRISRALKE